MAGPVPAIHAGGVVAQLAGTGPAMTQATEGAYPIPCAAAGSISNSTRTSPGCPNG